MRITELELSEIYDRKSGQFLFGVVTMRSWRLPLIKTRYNIQTSPRTRLRAIVEEIRALERKMNK